MSASPVPQTALPPAAAESGAIVVDEEEAPAAQTGSPSDFLKHVVGEHVVVRLNSGVDYRGTRGYGVRAGRRGLTLFAGVLSCLDGFVLSRGVVRRAC